MMIEMIDVQVDVIRTLIQHVIKDCVEACASRVESYALAVEVSRHIGQPYPVDALASAADKIRETEPILQDEYKLYIDKALGDLR